MQSSNPGRRDIFNLAWPMALNAIFLQLVLVIDTVLVTPLGAQSLAAMGLAASIGGVLIGFMFAFSNGTQLLLAQAYGAKDTQALATGLKAGLYVNLAIAVLGLVFIFTLSAPLIAAIAETEAMAELSMGYLRIFSVVLFAVAVSQNIRAYFTAIGNSKITFYSNILELPVNVFLSSVLIYGYWGFPKLELMGAAIGTAVAVVCRALFLVIYKYYHQRTQPALPVVAMDGAKMLHHLKYASPIAGNFITMVLAHSVCMMIYANLGVLQFAAFTLITPWVRVVGHISNSWSQATGVFVGQILGGQGGDFLDRFVSQAWRVAFGLSFLIAALYFGMFFLFRALYPELEQATLDTLWTFMPVLMVLPFIRVSNTICGNVLRAGGDAMFSFKVHALTQWLVTVPLSALFVLYFELPAVWIFGVILIEELIKGVPFHLRMYGGRWKNKI